MARLRLAAASINKLAAAPDFMQKDNLSC